MYVISPVKELQFISSGQRGKLLVQSRGKKSRTCFCEQATVEILRAALTASKAGL